MRFINEMREGDSIRGVYFCRKADTLTGKNGKNYMSLSLQDKTGVIDGKVWDLNAGIGNIEAMDYVWIEGVVTVFQGANQLNVRRVRRADEGEYSPVDYLPSSDKDIEMMYRELLQLVDSVKEEHMHALLNSFFRDNVVREEFKKHSAAKSVHHGFVGGLLEHTLYVTKLCDFLAANYPLIKRDLLVSAALLHDIGKLYEISDFPTNDYTDEGNLLGHIYIGAEKISKKIEEIEGFPAVTAAELKHCILSHHGELEYGSPKKPALIEAVALSMADNLDAKLENFKESLDAFPGNNGWLGFQKVLDSNIRRTSNE